MRLRTIHHYFDSSESASLDKQLRAIQAFNPVAIAPRLKEPRIEQKAAIQAARTDDTSPEG